MYSRYGYGHYGSSSLPNGIESLVVFYVVFLLVFLAVAVANYLFKAFGMYGMAKKMNAKYPWLAFIPFASNYLQGELAGDITVGKKTVKNVGLWTLLTPIIVGAVMFIVMFVFIFTTAFSVAMAEYASDFPFGAGFFFSVTLMSLFLAALSAAEYLVFGVVRYHIHKKYTDSSCAVGHMLLGLFIPLYQAIYFFVLRNRCPEGMENPYDSKIVGGDSVYSASPVSQENPVQEPAAPQPELPQQQEDPKPEEKQEENQQ